MGKGKILIITTIAMLSLTGVLAFNIITDQGKNKRPDKGRASASTVSSGAIIENNSGDYTYIPPTLEYDDNNGNEDDQNMTDNNTPWTPATEMDLDPKSITVFVNKEHSLPMEYVPEDLVIPDINFDLLGFDERKMMRSEAADALEELFTAAEKDGYTLYGVSGYRSFSRQKKIFTENIVKRGKTHTLKYSAAPGTSEHQTGLAMDVSSKSMNMKLIDAFATYPEGKWLAQNAHYYGYIIRYPENRLEVTGYAYEPWHIRYVGKDLAKYLFENNLTLDEYYNYVQSPNFDYEKEYADLINYKPTPTPTPTPTPSPTPTPPLEEEPVEEEKPEIPVDEIPSDDVEVNDPDEPSDTNDTDPSDEGDIPVVNPNDNSSEETNTNAPDTAGQDNTDAVNEDKSGETNNESSNDSFDDILINRIPK